MQKSPLQIPPNSLFRCTKAIKDKIPPKSIINSFLFFSGFVEFSLSNADRFVIAHTNKYVIYEFWRTVMTEPAKVADMAQHFIPIKSKRMFEIYQDTQAHYKGPFVRSAIMFALNQYSDTGMISSGNLKTGTPNPLCLTYLKNFTSHNFHIKFSKENNIVDSLEGVSDDEYILLPAGHYSMNLFEEGKSAGLEETKVYHKKIKDFFTATNKKTVLLYYWSPQVFEWYKSYDLKMYNKWGKLTENKEDCKEMVIANF